MNPAQRAVPSVRKGFALTAKENPLVIFVKRIWGKAKTWLSPV
jgi:hypothetical protein